MSYSKTELSQNSKHNNTTQEEIESRLKQLERDFCDKCGERNINENDL